MTEEKAIENYSVEEVKKWINEFAKFGEETSGKFEEQKIDGKALVYLSRYGSAQQFEACGIFHVGDQLHLKQLVVDKASNVEQALLAGVQWASPRNKPRKNHVKRLSDMNQRIYKAKRGAIRAAAIKKWPGNDLPTFKKRSKAMEDLNELVEELVPECSMEIGDFKFKAEGIKQHILDVMNERRRHIRKGYDYTKEDKRTIKKRKEMDLDSSSVASTSSGSTEILSSEHDDTDSELGQSQSLTTTHKSASSNGERENGSDLDLDDNGGSNNDEGDGPAELSTLQVKSLNTCTEDVPISSSKVIMQVAFNAVKFQDVSKQQILSAVKRFRLHRKPALLNKTEAAKIISSYLLAQKIVKVNCPIDKIDRNSVKKVKVF